MAVSAGRLADKVALITGAGRGSGRRPRGRGLNRLGDGLRDVLDPRAGPA